MLHHRCDVLLQKARHLSAREPPLSQPIGIVVIPDQAVAANLHAVRLSKAHHFVGRMEIKSIGSSPDNLPLHRIFRLDHVEFATERCSVSGFREKARTNRRAKEQVGSVGSLSERCGRSC